MSKVYKEEVVSPFVPMVWRELANIIIWGAVVGLLTWALAGVLDKYVFQAIMCHGDTATKCAASPNYANVTAAIVVAVVSLLGLVRLRVFRPLLIVIFATLTLWGVADLLIGYPWYWVLLASVFVYAVAYGLFAWIARIRTFWITVLVMVILLVVIRLVLNS